jgi:xylitol oxidase
VPAEFFGAPLDPGPVRLADAPADNLTPLGVPGPWAERLPHFRPDSTPSNGDEIQSEFFVDRSDGPAALAAVRALATLITPLLLVTEIRAIAADDLWLSGAYQRDTLAIHFTWRNQPGPVDAVLARVEEALAPFAPRPHWGKVSHLTPDGRYPRLADARAVFERLDPEGRFSNARLERLGVRLPRLPMPSRRGLPAQHPCLRHASAISPLPLSTLAGSRVITFCLSRRDG